MSDVFDKYVYDTIFDKTTEWSLYPDGRYGLRYPIGIQCTTGNSFSFNTFCQATVINILFIYIYILEYIQHKIIDT